MRTEQCSVWTEDLWKTYHLYDKPGDRLKEALSPWRTRYHRDFHALRGVTFSLDSGESLGIVGRNGSGKSTLLKILTGVLTPSSGSYGVKGSISSLLELGAGFNPELTGAENIYLQGTFQGYTHREMEAKFDRIAAFADIGQFLSQQVKKYSSGMFVRLAFACATVTEPDVLIVDEALAVGDGAFVHKCMSRISQLIDNGATLILVTHDVETVKRFCQKGLWLEEGQVRYMGAAGLAGDRYYAFWRNRNAVPEPASVVPSIEGDLPGSEVPVLHVQGRLDLSEDRLFVPQPWETVSLNEGLAAARLGRQGQSAVFRFQGSGVELCFGRGAPWLEPSIVIDGVPRPYSGFGELSGQGDPRISLLKFSLEEGRHEVRILVSEPGRAVCWIGGRCHGRAEKPAFRKDPRYVEGDPGGCGRNGNGRGRIVAAELIDPEIGHGVTAVRFRRRFEIHLWGECYCETVPRRIGFGVHIKDKNQNWIFGATNWDARLQCDSDVRRWHVSFGFENLLGEGDYAVLLSMAEADRSLDDAIHMDVIEVAFTFRSHWSPEHPHVWGSIYVPPSVTVDSYGSDA